MIRGPFGERRLDHHFTWLRQAVRAGYSSPRPTIEDCEIKYDYKDWFPKDAETALEELVANIDDDIASFISQFGKR
jgi:hypothetical protein